MAKWHCQKQLTDEAENLFSSSAIPLLIRQPGFIRAQLLGIDKETTRIALTTWENEHFYNAFVSSEDMRTITDMFRPMYVDDDLPVGTQYRILRDSLS